MKYLLGLFTLPSILGALVIFHVIIDTKDRGGKPITNRIARMELFWLSINKPHLFCENMKWVCLDIEESKK